MKQLLFLLLFPCLAMAQYTGNAGQKITLGEQTTADGLVFRGVASIDTVTATSKITRTNKQDTSAFLLLDTVTNLLWHYKTASNGWIQAGGSTFDTTTLNLVSRFALKLNISDTATMLTNYYRSGRALGTPSSGVLTSATGLPIAPGLSGLGAANRIPFASSATALTTTNKFTFDPTGNKLIIGKNDSLDSNPNFTINLSGSDAPSPLLGFRLYNTTLGKISAFRYDNNHSFIFSNNDSDNGLGSHRFTIGSGSGEEILTITRPTASGTDGRVGIGIISPTEKLHVVGNGLFTGNVTATRFNPTASTLTGTGMFLPAANTLGFSTNGTNRMTLDASGNLGLGVTPSAWATTSSYLALQVGSSGIYGRSAASNETYLTSNTYYNAGWKYIYSASATRYDQESGIHSWYNAASGTAGNPITFTQAMTLKSDSELQIAGTTDRGAYNLQVNGTGVWGEGAYVNGSDANIKENIVDLDSSLNIVNNLKPVIFNYINTSVNNDTKHLGFIAQDVYQILENKDYLNSIVRSDGETLSIAYSNLIPLLTKAIQEQNAIIKALEQRILILENK